MFDILLFVWFVENILFCPVHIFKFIAVFSNVYLFFIIGLSWNLENTFFTKDCQRLLFPLSANLCLYNNNSFHLLSKLIQDLLKNIKHNCEPLKICKKTQLFFITLSVFDKNVTKFWEDEIKSIEQTRKSSSSKRESNFDNEMSKTYRYFLMIYLPVQVDPF